MTQGMDWITVDFLTTFTGAVFITNIITHFIKDYTPDCIDKKIVTLFVALFVMFTNQYVFGALNAKTIYLSFLNSFLVSAAAMGNYELLRNKMRKREEKDQRMQENYLQEKNLKEKDIS